jgi:hypothetical protein
MHVFKFVTLSYKCSVSVNDLQQGNTTADASNDAYTLRCVRNKLDYRTDSAVRQKAHTYK